MKHLEYPSIGKFVNFIKDITFKYNYNGIDENGNVILLNNKIPKFEISGTVKIHGTNASVCEFNKKRYYQSKNRLIDINNDNAGFANFANLPKNQKIFDQLFEIIYYYHGYNPNWTYYIFGEWYGRGIQNSGAGVSRLMKKYFTPFDVIISNPDSKYLYYANDNIINMMTTDHIDIIPITFFPKFNVTIDPYDLETSAKILEEHTKKVSEKCPVSGTLENIIGPGEGIVWKKTCEDGETLLFKTKNPLFNVLKTKKIVEVDLEVLENVQKFVDYAVTENRLNQALIVNSDNENEENMKRKIGLLISWVYHDIIKEESDTIYKNELPEKELKRAISNKAAEFFRSKLL